MNTEEIVPSGNGRAEGGKVGPEAVRAADRTPRKGRHPCMIGWPVGVWNPDALGKIRGYPKTPEANEEHLKRLKAYSDAAREKGVLNRRGVPHGWAGKKSEVHAIREAALEDAKRVVRALCGGDPDLGEVAWKGPVTPGNPHPSAVIVMEHTLAMALSRCEATSTRLKAARLVMRYLMAPAGRAAVMQHEGGLLAWLETLARREREAEEE